MPASLRSCGSQSGRDLDDVDAAIVGIPYDGGSNTLRTGSRLGPRAIRENSLLIEGFHPRYGFNPLDLLTIIDCVDLAVELAGIERNIDLVAEQVKSDTWAATEESMAELQAAMAALPATGGDPYPGCAFLMTLGGLAISGGLGLECLRRSRQQT